MKTEERIIKKKTAFIIPSRSRPELVRRNADKWIDQGFPTFIIVEPHQYKEYRSTLRHVLGRNNFNLIRLGKNNQGIGYARRECVKFAFKRNFEYIIFFDDDIVPKNPIWKIVLPVKRKILSGCACFDRIYIHWNGIPQNDGIWQMKHMAMAGYAQNVKELIDAGNYTSGLRCIYEDDDMRTRLVQSTGRPWGVYTEFELTKRLGKAAAGGNASVTNDLKKCEQKCASIVLKSKYRKYVRQVNTDKLRSIRFQYTNLYRDLGLDPQNRRLA